MSKIIVFKNTDGGMSIMYPCDNVYVPEDQNPVTRFVTFEKNTPDDSLLGYRKATVEEIAMRDVFILGGTDWKIIEQDCIPSDNYFRAAWEHDSDGVVSVNMDKAKEVQKNNLRIERTNLLLDLDLQYMRADEENDAEGKYAIVLKKKALRDITIHPDIETAQTPEELKVAATSLLQES